MKNIIMASISFTFILVGTSSALARSESAKRDLQLIQKYQGSELSKKLIQRHCKSLPEVSELCKGSEMSPAQESLVEEAVKEDLQQQSVQSSSSPSVNVSQGSGTQQSSTVQAAYPGADCVQQVMQNLNKVTSGLAARLNKNINRAK